VSSTVSPSFVLSDAGRLYLDLMKGCLTRSIFGEKYRELKRPVLVGRRHRPLWFLHDVAQQVLGKWSLKLVQQVSTEGLNYDEGGHWPAEAETMVGYKRLDNIEHCIAQILRDNVPGDLIETGVWRGGAAIYMLAVLRAFEDQSRHVWLADSFEGLPKPKAEHKADAGDIHWMFGHILAVSLEEVKANVARYGLLDERVHFLKGWFCDTLPTAPIERLAMMRLDGDMYGSTMDALTNLYPKLSRGGFCVIDDYALAGCKQAVDEYRQRQGITGELRRIDHSAVYWRRE
jgi:O-methyltransferase